MSKQLILNLIIGLLLVSSPSYAQKGKIKKAYNYLEALDYQSAVDILLPMAESGIDAEVATLLGTIFRKQNSYSRAAMWYEKAVQLPEVTPSAYFYYGMVLLHINKCSEAQEQFDYFLSLNPLDARQFQLKDACTYRRELMQKQRELLDVQVLNFNSVFSDIGPAFYRNGLVFGSVRAPLNSDPLQKVDPFFDLYYVNMEDEHFKFSEPETFSSRLNSRVHEAIVTFSQDGSMIYFTRNKGVDNEHTSSSATGLEIVYAVSEDGMHWSELQLLPFNSPKYSLAHPSLTPDGSRLFFASDMPGGYGGKDIYVSNWETDYWGTPVNLGPLVNTEGDEMFPFFHPSGKLYFSSDGQVGLGGQDIFSTEPNKAGVWANIENVGAPVNTEFDDYGIIVSRDESYGYFTSNRPGGVGKDDIYGFQPIQALSTVTPQPNPATQNKVVIHVQVIDGTTGQRIENPEISNCEANLYRSVGTSSFQMNLYPGDCCEIAVDAEGYQATKVEICGDPNNRNRAVVMEKVNTAAPATSNTTEVANNNALTEVIPAPKEEPTETVAQIVQPAVVTAPKEEPVENKEVVTKVVTPPIVTAPNKEPLENKEVVTKVAPPPAVPVPTEEPVENKVAVRTPESNLLPPPQEVPVVPAMQQADPPATPALEEEQAIAVSNETPEEEVEPSSGAGVIEETTEFVRQTTRSRKVTKYLIGTVYDPLNSRPIPFATIHLLNSTCGVNLKIQSDESGHYRLPLISSCCINIRVEKEGFQTYTAVDALCTDKAGNIKGSTSILLKPDPNPPAKKISNETTMLLNRGAFDGFERSKNTNLGDAGMAFILNVYYETARTSVKEESVEDLKKLLKLLEENPTLIVEIGAHTDSRGSATYNEDLSQRRAENVVKYLLSQGINEKRLLAKGYGETQLINDCTDDKECSEEAHQVNRRTEFRVLGSLDTPE